MSRCSLADLTGRTAVVTGASSGIGLVTARALAERRARVVLAVRDPEKGEAAAATLTGPVQVRALDLADLSSLRAFARHLPGSVDLLVNNAGLSLGPLSRTADGFELQFGTNHLGHFALTNLLLPRIRERVVTVAFLGHRIGSLDFTDLQWERRPYRPNAAYTQSKLANLLFAAELQRRLTRARSPVISTAAHPGISSTNLMRAVKKPSLGFLVEKFLIGLVVQSAEESALPTLNSATADLPGNSYVGPGWLRGMRGAPRPVGRSTRARDGSAAVGGAGGPDRHALSPGRIRNSRLVKGPALVNRPPEDSRKDQRKNHRKPDELVVVSGASSGIGAATACALAEMGYHVLAGVRTDSEADAVRADGIEPVTLDITVPHHVEALARRIADDPEQRALRVLVNNAGIEINAPVEALPLALWREQFEVNLFGHIAVIQKLLPFLRRSRGRIVNISSVGGVAALPVFGAYAGTKFALEAASDSLRREVSAHGVQVVVVQPGGVRTEMAARSGDLSLELAAAMSTEHQHLYGHLINATVASNTAFLERALPAAKAGAKIARVATTPRPRARYTLGTDAAFIIPLTRFLPSRLMDAILTMSHRPRKPKTASTPAPESAGSPS